MQTYSESFEETFSNALDRALQSVLGRAAKVTNFYVDPGVSVKSPDVYVELLKKIFSPELVSALVNAIGRELAQSLGFQLQQDATWKLSEYVSYAQQPLQLRLELESGNTLGVGTEKELKIMLVNRTLGDMQLTNCNLQLPAEISLLEPSKSTYDLEGVKLGPSEVHALTAKIRATRVGQVRVSARATMVDPKGRSNLIEVPYVLVVVEREGRLPTGSAIADNLLLGGLPRHSAVLLTCSACDEKDDLVQGFCATAPTATVYVSSDVHRSLQLHKLYPELRQVVCGPQADLLPKTQFIQVSGTLDNISEINILVMRALETIADENPRIFLQLISDILLLHKEVTTRHWLANLLPRLRARHCTVLAELNLRMHGSHEVNALFDLFDGRLEILEHEETGMPMRFLRITSLRGHKYLPHQAPLTPQ